MEAFQKAAGLEDVRSRRFRTKDLFAKLCQLPLDDTVINPAGPVPPQRRGPAFARDVMKLID